MKLVIDLQAMQGESRHRGIGRYAADITRAFVELAHGKYEIWIALNAQLGHAERVRALFGGLIPQDRIVSYSTTGATMSIQAENAWRNSASEILREDFLRGLNPDIVWGTSLFEGWVDDSVTSLGLLFSQALHVVTVYDLIPLANSDVHLADPRVRNWYYRKLGHIKRADALLAISEHTREEVTELLNIPAERVTNVSAATSQMFRRSEPTPESVAEIKRKFGLQRPFVLYVGGYDARKNVKILVQAYATLPTEIRHRYCLALGGRIMDGERAELRASIREAGLAESDVVFTGQVDDAELVSLYNLCELFVFPSLKEGFGLPVLEAMACGAPVLAARTSSLPEVVGRQDMLFDPHRPEELSRSMAKVLLSAELKADLASYGERQAANFSWRKSAQRVFDAFERLFEARGKRQAPVSALPAKRMRLAYVSPLPPERTGIANYSSELLMDLGRHYDIEVVIGQGEVFDDWITSNYPIRSAAWFDENAWRFDRILYQFGNSPFHSYQVSLMRKHPGTVVLHDSFLGAYSAWRASAAGQPHTYLQRLYESHGYFALIEDAEKGRAHSVAQFPSSLEIIRQANGVLVHSQYAINHAARIYGANVSSHMRRIPFPKRPESFDRAVSRAALGLDPDDFIVCSFGMIAPTKLNERLLDAWLASRLADDERCRLVFVGENHGGDYGQALLARMAENPSGRRIRITGYAEPDAYRAWLGAADLTVQLRTESRGETSKSTFDCMAQGVPLIVNAHATLAELDPTAVHVLPDLFTDQQLIDLLHAIHDSLETRQKFGGKAQSIIQTTHHPDSVASQYRDAIEHFALHGQMARQAEVAEALARLPVPVGDDMWRTAQALSRNYVPVRQRQLLVDITSLARDDLKTGIERVTRNIVHEWIRGSVDGMRIEPVRFHEGGYVYARSYTLKLLGLENPELVDEAIEVAAGDVFFGLDWGADFVPGQQALFQSWRDRGVSVFFAVYDLLPVLRPKAFPPGIDGMHAIWLRSIATCADGLCCISRTVASELSAWLSTQNVDRKRALAIGYSYLGAELDPHTQSGVLSADARALLSRLANEPMVLMVGTIEPRKGHVLALDAFDVLWRGGSSSHLVVVGKQGWMTEQLIARIKTHPEIGKHLHWLTGVDDGYLDRLYETANVLLAASEGEGFGLPLIEAARRQLPIIARDIPVFREVAGDSALYFHGNDAVNLAKVINTWFELDAGGKSPMPTGIQWLSWKQSAMTLGRMVTDWKHSNWLYAWRPGVTLPVSTSNSKPVLADVVTTSTSA
jgi:glycosyltransferase involved in cell wall biosynthesis